jgi:hypothetical protein
MSTAVLETAVEQPITIDLALERPELEVEKSNFYDPHPLLPVFVAIAISLMVSGMFIGSILVWLSLRHSGVMAP